MTNGAITWRNRAATAAARRKRKISGNSFSIPSPRRRRCSSISWGSSTKPPLNGDDRKTAELIIGNIDDNGFLQTTPEEMALNTGIAQEDFEHMLTLIQSFYPPGVGARDLRECLLIQLKREGKGSSLEYKIIPDHMPDLGKRRFPEIARRMGISVEQVQKCANNIAQLDPRPGAIFAAGSARITFCRT